MGKRPSEVMFTIDSYDSFYCRDPCGSCYYRRSEYRVEYVEKLADGWYYGYIIDEKSGEKIPAIIWTSGDYDGYHTTVLPLVPACIKTVVHDKPRGCGPDGPYADEYVVRKCYDENDIKEALKVLREWFDSVYRDN